MPVDLHALFECLRIRHAAASLGGQPEHRALDALLECTLQRGREALERFRAHGRDPVAEKLMLLACDAGLSYKRLLLIAVRDAPSRPELALLVADLQLLIVELFEQVSGESSTPRPAPILH